jgi:hypothetical protein
VEKMEIFMRYTRQSEHFQSSHAQFTIIPLKMLKADRSSLGVVVLVDETIDTRTSSPFLR